MSGDRDNPMIPDIPHPNSRTAEFASRTLCLNSRFDEVIQEAKRGVIFQTTYNLSDNGTSLDEAALTRTSGSTSSI